MKNEKLRIAVLALVMMWGMGVGAKDVVIEIGINPTNLTGTAIVMSQTFTINGISFTMGNYYSDTGKIKGNESDASKNFYLYNNDKFPGKLKSVTLKASIDDSHAHINTSNSTKKVTTKGSGKNPIEGTWSGLSVNFFCISLSQGATTGDVYMTGITIVYDDGLPEDFTISDAKYATFYSDYSYTMPDGLIGYTINNQIQLVESYTGGTAVPAKEALLISGASGNYQPASTSTSKTPISENLLHGTSAEQNLSGDGTYYQFSYDSEGRNLGFYWQTADGTSITNAANRCYLLIPTTSAIKAFTLSDLFNTEEEASIINTTLPHRDSNAYSLTGLPVSPAYRGIVIKDGKKILRK